MKFIDKINAFTKNSRLDLQTAIETAREKLKGQGKMVAIAGLLVLASFIFIAIIAPIAYKTKGIFSTILSFFPMLILSIGIFIAVRGVFLIGKEEKSESNVQYKGTLAKTAIEIAIQEAIDAGLINENSSQFIDSLSGISNGFAFVAFKTINMGCYVIRLKKEFNSVLVANPKNALWPVKLPTNKKLTPLIPPDKLPLDAWGLANENGREISQTCLNSFTNVLNMSFMGGELPFIYAEDKSFIIGFKTGDIGTICLIGNEMAKSIRGEFGN